MNRYCFRVRNSYVIPCKIHPHFHTESRPIAFSFQTERCAVPDRRPRRVKRFYPGVRAARKSVFHTRQIRTNRSFTPFTVPTTRKRLEDGLPTLTPPPSHAHTLALRSSAKTMTVHRVSIRLPRLHRHGLAPTNRIRTRGRLSRWRAYTPAVCVRAASRIQRARAVTGMPVRRTSYPVCCIIPV